MALVDNFSFEDRSKISGKSFESHVLILNFGDSHIITLHQVLETPIEVTTIEWHPENKDVLFGGCLNGQIIVWDMTCMECRIQTNKTNEGPAGGDDDDNAVTAVADEGEKSQVQPKMRHLLVSAIARSHKNYVADIQFVPTTVNVIRNQNSEGKQTHFMSVSEDGLVSFWDSRHCSKEEVLKMNFELLWQPVNQISLLKMDQSSELGLARILLQSG